MKQLCFHYHMHLDFDAPVFDHRFTLKCVPQTDGRQVISDLAVAVHPHDFVSHGKDGFGNATLYGHMAEGRTSFYVDVQGVATLQMEGAPDLESAILALRYQSQSAMTKVGDCLLAAALPMEGSNLERATALMDFVHERIQYTKAVTTVETTAEQAMAKGQGVCQDQAHALIALCRRANIPARYVAGFLVGEGYSHGWVEIFQPVDGDLGQWIGLDPTNQILVTDQHIKVATGRDAKDCLLNRGIFRGNAMQSQWSSVIVYEQL